MSEYKGYTDEELDLAVQRLSRSMEQKELAWQAKQAELRPYQLMADGVYAVSEQGQ